jgi:hypothetical protein
VADKYVAEEIQQRVLGMFNYSFAIYFNL